MEATTEFLLGWTDLAQTFTVGISGVAGEGDLVEILTAKTYQIGDVVEHHGKQHLVLSDDGDEITLAVPEDRVPLRGGYTVRVAAGNSTLVSKVDLVLATFGQATKKQEA